MGSPSSSQQRALLLLSSRSWDSALADRLSRRLDRRVERITAPAQLTLGRDVIFLRNTHGHQ